MQNEGVIMDAKRKHRLITQGLLLAAILLSAVMLIHALGRI